MKTFASLLAVAAVLAFGLPVALGMAGGLVVGFYAGQFYRGWQHARGIRQSHFAAIRGNR